MQLTADPVQRIADRVGQGISAQELKPAARERVARRSAPLCLGCHLRAVQGTGVNAQAAVRTHTSAPTLCRFSGFCGGISYLQVLGKVRNSGGFSAFRTFLLQLDILLLSHGVLPEQLFHRTIDLIDHPALTVFTLCSVLMFFSPSDRRASYRKLLAKLVRLNESSHFCSLIVNQRQPCVISSMALTGSDRSSGIASRPER